MELGLSILNLTLMSVQVLIAITFAFHAFVKQVQCTRSEIDKIIDTLLIKCFIQQLNPPPAFLAERDILFEKLKAAYDAKLEGTNILSICVIMLNIHIVLTRPRPQN